MPAMKIFDRRPWYADGLAFECLRCGRCCAGPEEGYVWVTPAEIAALAGHLSVPQADFEVRFVRRVNGRYSLTESPANRDCIFLRYDDQGHCQCRVYPVRPTQCRTWPFWPLNLARPENWVLAGTRCPGVNRGSLHDVDEIQHSREQANP